MTARASAAFCSSPAPPIAIGIMPTIIAAAVISTGRIRVWPALSAASKAECPLSCCSRAKVTSRIEFADATPTAMIAPISDGTFSVVPVMKSIVTMLFITGTTLNVPSLMGAIMAVGVASANSILLVTFAREQQLKGHSAFEAALSAGHTRIRPVLMTAAAMIVGMIPMAIGGAGEEQNAALARAVIGGLLFATPTTLLVVPYLFAMLRKRNDGKPHHGVFEEIQE